MPGFIFTDAPTHGAGTPTERCHHQGSAPLLHAC
jgi:hypothetical protein